MKTTIGFKLEVYVSDYDEINLQFLSVNDNFEVDISNDPTEFEFTKDMKIWSPELEKKNPKPEKPLYLYKFPGPSGKLVMREIPPSGESLDGYQFEFECTIITLPGVTFYKAIVDEYTVKPFVRGFNESIDDLSEIKEKYITFKMVYHQ